MPPLKFSAKTHRFTLWHTAHFYGVLFTKIPFLQKPWEELLHPTSEFSDLLFPTSEFPTSKLAYIFLTSYFKTSDLVLQSDDEFPTSDFQHQSYEPIIYY